MSDLLPEAAAAKPPRPRNAASLVLVRGAGDKLEVLMGKRPRKSRFAPDVFVFPGGGVEPGDYMAQTSRPLDPACAKATGASPRLAHALAAAALRETEEETGVVLPPDHGALRLIARAITPVRSPIRFHARFFLADADTAIGDHADSAELTDLAFRRIEETTKLPLMDVTEAVLAALSKPGPPFLYSYQGGRPRRRMLA